MIYSDKIAQAPGAPGRPSERPPGELTETKARLEEMARRITKATAQIADKRNAVFGYQTNPNADVGIEPRPQPEHLTGQVLVATMDVWNAVIELEGEAQRMTELVL